MSDKMPPTGRLPPAAERKFHELPHSPHHPPKPRTGRRHAGQGSPDRRRHFRFHPHRHQACGHGLSCPHPCRAGAVQSSVSRAGWRRHQHQPTGPRRQPGPPGTRHHAGDGGHGKSRRPRRAAWPPDIADLADVDLTGLALTPSATHNGLLDCANRNPTAARRCAATARTRTESASMTDGGFASAGPLPKTRPAKTR